MSEKNRKAPVLSATTKELSASPSPNPQDKIWKRLSENESVWDLSEVRKNSEGYYCPRGKQGEYNFRSLWLRESIPLAFNKLEIKFIVRKEKKETKPLRSVLQLGNVLSRDYKVSNFYLPFDGSEGVNFERYVAEKYGLEFQPNPGELQLPIEENTPVKVTIRTTSVSENTLSYAYKVEYIPKGEESSVTKTFPYSVILPDPSPKDLIVDFGLGIFIGACLSDVEYLTD